MGRDVANVKLSPGTACCRCGVRRGVEGQLGGGSEYKRAERSADGQVTATGSVLDVVWGGRCGVPRHMGDRVKGLLDIVLELVGCPEAQGAGQVAKGRAGG